MRTTPIDRPFRRRARLAGAATAAALLIAACGGGSDDTSSPAGDAPSDVAPGGDAPGGDAPADAASGGDANLSTAPIPFRDLFDYRDGSEPIARTETVQLDACPLLSLETLNASSGTYSEPTTLSSATAQRCSFANGAAFSFTVEVEAAADVDVDNHSGRAYNIDVEPIVEPQSGPGEKAVILIDTAFSDGDPDEGFRYLYFFVQGDQAVTLRSTAFKIRDDGWRALADEVAANLESGAAGGEVETVEVVDEVEPYTIEPCGFVTIEQLEALTGFEPGSITANHFNTSFRCRWEHPEQLGLAIDFRALQNDFTTAADGFPEQDRSDELGVMAVGQEVIFDVWLVADDPRGFSVNADREGWFPAAEALAVNLVQRIEKPAPL